MGEVNADSMDKRLEISTKDEDYESGGDSAYATIQVNLEDYKKGQVISSVFICVSSLS